MAKSQDKTPAISALEIKSPIRVGNRVLVRLVTCYYTGEIVGVTMQEVLLAHCAWIPQIGRFHSALATGVLEEVEPYPDRAIVSLNRGAIADVSDWLHDLPRAAK